MTRSLTQRYLETKAFIVRSTDYGEADRILQILTLHDGKLSVLAKAARKSRRRFGAALSPYTAISVRIQTRPNGLWLLTDATVAESFPRLAASLSRMALAGYFTELARETVPERKPEPEIFDLLQSACRLLDRIKPNKALVRAFELNLLHRLGLTPQLTRCQAAGCGRDIPPARSAMVSAKQPLDEPAVDESATAYHNEPTYGLSPALGGILCPDCAARFPSIPLEPEAVTAMTRLAGMGIAEAALSSEDLSKSVNEQIKAALAPILLDLVGHPLKSVAFINQLQNIRLSQDGVDPHGAAPPTTG